MNEDWLSEMEQKDSALQNSHMGPKAVEKMRSPVASPSGSSSLGAPHRPGTGAAPELLTSCLKLRGHKLPTTG